MGRGQRFTVRFEYDDSDTPMRQPYEVRLDIFEAFKRTPGVKDIHVLLVEEWEVKD
jgi:hypothetical protein